MKPDPAKHDPRPEYIRALLHQAGLTQAQGAETAGVTARMMRRYVCTDKDGAFTPVPYSVQYLLESLLTGRQRWLAVREAATSAAAAKAPAP